MKQQIARFSPHQNGKVFAVLLAISSLVFVVPFFIFELSSPSKELEPPLLFLALLPFFYLVLGYVMVAVGCAVYNIMFRHIGGIEFESRSTDA